MTARAPYVIVLSGSETGGWWNLSSPKKLGARCAYPRIGATPWFLRLVADALHLHQAIPARVRKNFSNVVLGKPVESETRRRVVAALVQAALPPSLAPSGWSDLRFRTERRTIAQLLLLELRAWDGAVAVLRSEPQLVPDPVDRAAAIWLIAIGRAQLLLGIVMSRLRIPPRRLRLLSGTTFAAELRKALRRGKLSPGKLARRAGVDSRTPWRWTAGDRPSSDRMAALARTLVQAAVGPKVRRGGQWSPGQHKAWFELAAGAEALRGRAAAVNPERAAAWLELLWQRLANLGRFERGVTGKFTTRQWTRLLRARLVPHSELVRQVAWAGRHQAAARDASSRGAEASRAFRVAEWSAGPAGPGAASDDEALALSTSVFVYRARVVLTNRFTEVAPFGMRIDGTATPASPLDYFRRGRAMIAWGDPLPGAREQLETAASQGDERARVLLAELAVEEERPVDAVDALRRWAPRDPVARRHRRHVLGLAYLTLGRGRLAWATLAPARRTDPADGRALELMAVVAEIAGDYRRSGTLRNEAALFGRLPGRLSPEERGEVARASRRGPR